MACYLAYTSPARGHLYPLVATLLELRQRGHEVHVRTLASEVAALEALGLHASAIAAAIEKLPLDDWRWSTPEEALAGGLRTFGERAVHEVPDLERAIAHVKPDVLLVDITTVGAAALAEAAPIPWAQWIPFFQHFGLVAGASPPEPTLVPFTLAPAGMEVLNAPRSGLGLPPLAARAEAWRAPLYLYYTAPPFEVEGLPFPPSFRLLGPGLWEPAAPAPDWLHDLDEPLVLVSASSEFQCDEALLEIALEALRSEDVRVVATTVAHDPDRFDAPANARVVRWLPHDPLVRKAACVVCHGGMGITQKALAAGVPVCVVPFGRDQSEVGARVSAARAGTRVLPDALSPASLLTAIQDAIGMRAGAQRVAAGFARAGGAPAAAEALESLLPGTDGGQQGRPGADPPHGASRNPRRSTHSNRAGRVPALTKGRKNMPAPAFVVPLLAAAATASGLEPGTMVVYQAGEAVPESQLSDLGAPADLGATVLEGNPRISARMDHAHEGMLAGVFQATRGKVLVHFPFTEHATILHGEVRLTDQWGNRQNLQAGDSYFIRQGSDILWEVRGPRVQKSFFNFAEPSDSPAPMIVYDAHDEVAQSELTDLGAPETLGATVLSGDPKISARTDYAAAPATAGIFQATRGDVQIRFPFTEHATVLSGAVTLTAETGARQRLGVGDSYLVRQASSIFWQLKQSRVQKSFFNIVEE